MSDKNIKKSIESLEIIAEYIGENYFFSKDGIRNLKNNIKNVLDELETYKKIAEKLAHYIWKYDCCEYEIGKNGKCEGYYIDKDCTEQCIIDWARKEVEKDD